MVKNSLTKVFGANQKIITEKKIKINPTVTPALPSDEKISNIPIILSLMCVGKMKPKTRIKQYRVVNILYILKTDDIFFIN